jgi:hypothetical protein
LSATRSTRRQFTALLLVVLIASISAATLRAQEQSYPPPPPDETYNQYPPAQQYSQPAPPRGPSGYAPQPSPSQYGYDQPQPSPSQYGYDQPQPGYAQSEDEQQQGLGPDQLEQLVAPIALYPDPLVALVLAASTYPQQVQQADQWRRSQGYVSPNQIVYGADQQNWDPSVKGLTAFPQVLAEMDQNSQWTYALGNAYYNQPQDILQAVQIMRQRAQAAGNLQSTPQESVDYDQGNIQLMPANPQVLYVPSYNPWTAYGDPVAPYPGFSLLGAVGSFLNSSLGSTGIQYGLGIVLSAFDHTPWGLLSWGLDWLGENLLFHQSDYYSNSPYVSDWGLRYGGPRAGYAPRHDYSAYGWNRSRDRYGRDGRGNWNNRSRESYNRGYRNQYAYNRASYRSNFADRPGNFRRVQSPFANRENYNGSYGSFNRSFDRSHSFERNSGRFNRSQSFSSRNFGGQSSFTGRSYRAPSTNYTRRSFDSRQNFGRGNNFSRSYKAPRSSGFHLFGGGRSNSGFGHQSFKAPHYKAPRYHASHSGGGHHSFGGGGHHYGGGGHHSGGGGHHSGGHHR